MSCEHDDLEDDDGWECPTCLRPMTDEIDYECGTCEAKASEHLRVTTLCKLLRETQRRENSLIVQLSDAKTSVEHWQEKAKQADEAANDLVAELIDTRREWKEELSAERALADRLAEGLKGIWPFIEEDIPHGCNSTAYMNAIELCRANITAWKEARND